MYFSAKLAIDPSRITEIYRHKPDKAFGKILYYLSAGLLSQRQEYETFTAVSILQQLNKAFRSLGIDNIVRLARDGVDYYLDTSGKTNDLAPALQKFEKRAAHICTGMFNQLYLVVEHNDTDIRYLIEVRIERKHRVIECPINIEINGLMKKFHHREAEGIQELELRLSNELGTRTEYEFYTNARKAHFTLFAHKLDLAVRKYIGVDSLQLDIAQNIIRPRRPLRRPEDMRITPDPEISPVFHGYHGYNTAFLYAWVWAAVCRRNNIHIKNVRIVDESGRPMLDVHTQGFDAAACATLDPAAEFEAAPTGEVYYKSGHDYDAEFLAAGIDTETGPPEEKLTWLERLGFESGYHYTDYVGGGNFSKAHPSACGTCFSK